jgi:ATP-binding cassette, subfamily B, multidrug efflux pump
MSDASRVRSNASAGPGGSAVMPFGGPPRPGGPPGGPGGMGFAGPKEKARNAKGAVLRVWGYLGHQGKGLAVVAATVVANAALGIAGPYLIGTAIDRYIVPADFHGLAGILAVLLAAYAAGALITWLQAWVLPSTVQDTVRDIRKGLFGKLLRLPLRFFDGKTHGELMSRLANDVENVNNTLSQSTVTLLSSVITLAGTLAVMLALNPLLTLVSLVTTPLMTVATRKIAGLTRRYFKRQQEVLGELNGTIEETVSGQRVVKAFCRESRAMEAFDASNTALRDIGIKAQVLSGVVGPMMNLLNNVTFAVVAGVGGYLAVRGLVTVGIIAAFLNYAKQFARPLNEIANQVNMIQSALAGAERVFEVMDEPPEPNDAPDAATLADVRGEVSFRNVSFGYQKGVTVLHDMNLEARPGRTVALVGPTGAGKTTIVNLLSRFYDVDRGAILIDGHDIRAVRRSCLRSSLGIVLQETHLFSETVRENIRYGRLAATDREVEEAARTANAEHFILRLHAGYDTPLSEDGGNLSQGQRQLLSIARAVLADPAILILDEATSSVDTRTESHIQQAMIRLMSGRTCFVIAHRLSTIRDASEILVVHGGRIAERGTHDDLMKAGGFYYGLYKSQSRGEKT